MTFYDIFVEFLKEQMVHDDYDQIIDNKIKGREIIFEFLKSQAKEKAFPITNHYLYENSYRFVSLKDFHSNSKR